MEFILVGSQTLHPFGEKSLTDKSQCKKDRDSKVNTFFHSKPMEESVILNVQNMG